MERRSTRGRVSETPTGNSVRGVTIAVSTITTATSPQGATSLQVMEEVEVASEEIVLNRRGMPARQRKRNRFYFDDDNIVTGESMRKSTAKSPIKKVKQEPVDTYEDVTSEIDSTGFPPFVQEEVQIQSTPRGNSALSKFSMMAAKTAKTMLKTVERINKEQFQYQANLERKKRSEDTPGNKGVVVVKNAIRPTPAPIKPTAIVKQETPKSKPEKVARGDKTPKGKPATVNPPSQKTSKTSTVYTIPVNKSSGKDKFESTNRHMKGEGTAPRGRPPKAPEAHTSKVRTSESTTKASKEPPVRIKKEIDTSPRSSSRSERDEREWQQQRVFEMDEKEKERREKEKRKDKERSQKERDRDREFIPSTSKSNRIRRPSTPVNSYLLHGSHQSEHQEKQTIDKKIAHDISLRLRNLLKLPKAHKWVCYEWFYSNIDKVLFEGENDFQICLKESFPQLKARKLTRVEWCKIRRLMGKPRRCSQAFFDEEREELARRRQKIRMIQQRKITDFNYKELPDEIPLQLVIGTKVTARLRKPQDGLFTGTIEGVDTSNNTYRITFDRGGLGTHSIPDYEVLSNEAPETVSTSSFALKIPRRSYAGLGSGFKFQNPSLMGEDGMFGGLPKSPFPVDGMLGGFPIRLLDMIVRLSKLLKAKREKILQLKELNVEAEKMRSYSKQFNEDYRLRYARCVLDLDSMNKEMSMYLEGIQQYCLEIAPDHGANQMIVPEDVQSQCKQEANLIVDTYNTKQNRNLVHNSNSLALISNLTSLLLQVKTLQAGDQRNLYELKSIKDTVREVKATLVGKNVQQFQDRIEIPMNRIQAGLCVSGTSKSF